MWGATSASHVLVVVLSYRAHPAAVPHGHIVYSSNSVCVYIYILPSAGCKTEKIKSTSGKTGSFTSETQRKARTTAVILVIMVHHTLGNIISTTSG